MRAKTERAKTERAKTERAFTLVEILTVIVIISILASLVTLAVAGALRSAKRARAATEMSQIAMALEHYKAEFGEYPPDFFDDAALVRHVKKRWPRFELYSAIPPPDNNWDAYHADRIRQAISNVYNNRTFYPPALRREWLGTDQGATYISFWDDYPQANLAALCFWLGGFPDKEGKYLGFGADPEAPFGRNNNGDGDVNNGKNFYAAPNNSTDVVIKTYDKKNMMELTVNKNVYFGGGGSIVVPCIVARVSSEEVVPLVYFRGKTDGGPAAYLANDLKFFDFAKMGVSAGLPAVSGWPQLGFSVPYAKGGNPFANPPLRLDVEWCEPTKYQIIHPGLDLHFGNAGTTSPAMSPFTRNNFRSLKADAVGNNLGQKDLDNLTNFSEGKELKSILP